MWLEKNVPHANMFFQNEKNKKKHEVAFAKTKQENVEQRNVISSLTSLIERTKDDLRAEESIRRDLHETILALKGNIRVFCCIRPSLPSEEDAVLVKVEVPTETNLVISRENQNEAISGGRRKTVQHSFTFDQVFESASQHDVYSEICELIQSALDGFNVTIFTYGATGCGKTYTMEGDVRDRDLWGIIPRSLEQVFQSCENLKSKGWQYEIEASFVEIYNEAIRDLLGSGDMNAKHDLRIGDQNDVVVTNLHTVAVTSSDEVSSLLKKAGDNRAVAATKCNARSSRSHSVFSLKMIGYYHFAEERCQGCVCKDKGGKR